MARTVWRRFRRLPAWAQIASWVLLGVIALALSNVHPGGGPARREPATPEEIAVAEPIRAFLSALAAGDAARACAHLTPGAQRRQDPLYPRLRCRPTPRYPRDRTGPGGGSAQVYDVTIDADRGYAEAVVASGPGHVPGWDVSLQRVGDRWLISGLRMYSYVGG